MRPKLRGPRFLRPVPVSQPERYVIERLFRSEQLFLRRSRILAYEDANVTPDATRFIVGKFNPFIRENLAACCEPLTVDRAGLLTCTPLVARHDSATEKRGNLHNAMSHRRLVAFIGRPDNGASQCGTSVGTHMRHVKPEGSAGPIAAVFQRGHTRPATAHVGVLAAGIEDRRLLTAPIWPPVAAGSNRSRAWTRS